MKTLLAALIFLVVPIAARADTFTILFDEGSTVFQEADWSGTYTYPGDPPFGFTTFNALIGDCADPDSCTYDLATLGNANPLGSSPFPETVVTNTFGFPGRLDYFPATRLWFTLNFADSQLNRFGSYTAFRIPEPPAWLLLGFGLIVLNTVAPHARK